MPQIVCSIREEDDRAMANRTIEMTDALYDYFASVSLRESDLQRRLRDETAQLPNGSMQVAPEQGQFLAMLVQLLRAKRTFEVGVFTGYSSLTTALALPDDGRIIACDMNETWTGVARRYWREAGVDHKIDLRLGPAVQTLDGLIADGQAGSFDFAFIDADKANYDNYYERALVLLRPAGLMAIDNMLWHGKPIDPAAQDNDTLAIRAINAKLHQDQRISLSLVPIGDGITLAFKRP
jgi:predicted O-methyltransferase YrrM